MKKIKVIDETEAEVKVQKKNHYTCSKPKRTVARLFVVSVESVEIELRMRMGQRHETLAVFLVNFWLHFDKPKKG